MGQRRRSLAGPPVEHCDRRADRVLERLWPAARHQLCVDGAVFAARRDRGGNGGQCHHAFSKECLMKIADVRMVLLWSIFLQNLDRFLAAKPLLNELSTRQLEQ